VIAGATGLTLLAGCFADRERPAPPLLHIVLDQDSVTSPDTITGSILVTDRDGIDSIWLTVDTVRRGDDAFFETRYGSTFKFPIRSGLTKFDRVPVVLEARDVVGFSGALDTVVVVK
jgi:hypothetical protein